MTEPAPTPPEWQPDRPIFLCGMMGSGKTTVGRRLARNLQIRFADLDDEICKDQKLTIPEIFERSGEPGFRKVEREVLMRLAERRHTVLALGGGALQDQQVVDHLKKSGWLIFLEAPLSVLSERLGQETGRPLLGDAGRDEIRKKIEKLLQERIALYRQSHLTIDTGASSPDAIAETIVSKLQQVQTSGI